MICLDSRSGEWEEEKGRIQPDLPSSVVISYCTEYCSYSSVYSYWPELLFFSFFSGLRLVVIIHGWWWCRRSFCHMSQYLDRCLLILYGVHALSSQYSTVLCIYTLSFYSAYPVQSLYSSNLEPKIAAVLPSDWRTVCIIR